MTENEACLSFSLCNGVGPKTFLKFIQKFGSALYAWEKIDEEGVKERIISPKQYEKFDVFRKNFNLETYLEKLKKTRVKIVGYTSEKYPELLKELESPPIVLFCKGNLELLNSERKIGIVGARKITSYGKDATEKLTSELVYNGFTIISGLAMGVDATVHTTTIRIQGKTIAVLGCGVDCCTPQENQNLYEQILDRDGLIISEYSLGTSPSAGSFPARNRIIAGLSQGVLITEAAEDSGSLITAEEARKLERPVFAVPGGINSRMSRGALKLIKEGAFLVSSAEDILDKLNMKVSVNLKLGTKGINLTVQEKNIIDKLQKEELSIDRLSKITKIPILKLMILVSSLEMRGIIQNRGGEISLKH